MRKALVLGIEHEMGALLCKTLAKYNWHVTATIDDPSQPIELTHNLTLAEISPTETDFLDELIEDSDTVFLHLPDPTLGGQVLFPLETITALIAKHKRHLVLTTNFYEVKPSLFSAFTFWREKKPLPIALSAKLHSQLERAAEAGAHITVRCCGHSLSCAQQHGYLGMLIKETHNKLIVQSPSRYTLNHYWTFLPDLAENIVHQLSTPIAKQLDTPRALDVTYYPGHQASIKDIARCLALSSGKPVTVTHLHWTVMECISLFSPLFRGFLSMRRIWQHGSQIPSQRSSTASQAALFHTPLELALQQSWRHMK
ncbi:hypothetical protein L4C36_16165 [Photobacterium japonica]|uniref:hypothetical protein n=1 Tax=Photobacterium japonica TaxID=2910235 RepID=UPI003D0D8093